MILLLLACAAKDPSGVGADASRWAPPWPDAALYASSSVDSLDALDGARDTATEISTPLYASVAADGDGYRWLVTQDDDRTEHVLDFHIALDGDLVVSAGAAGAYSPPVVWIPKRFDDGDSTVSGGFTTTVAQLETVQTWYGSFDDVVQISIEGPASDPLTGQLRISEIAGPIQFLLGGVAADLVWYE